MKSKYSELLEVFSQKENTHLLLSGKWGLEKESLRVNPDGSLALTPHPKSLGSSFSHPYITTDYSESQLELITPAYKTVEEAYYFLEQLHLFVLNNISGEKLWPLSMPCHLPDSENIPIAYYGESQEAKQKEIYRRGLARRYGKKMQMICGLHYNFSFSDDLLGFLYKKSDQTMEFQDFKNKAYFALARNFLRYRWLLVYLLGASPVVDESYRSEVIKSLDAFGDDDCRGSSYHKENAISLRMSKYGYSNTRQTNVRVSYDSLEQYISDLRKALHTKDERYTKIGLHKDGEQIQLNDNLLQIENEYYTPIHFKQHLENRETMLQALEKKGVNHIEIRALDLDPFEPFGVNLEKLHFLQVFFLFCFFEDCDSLDDEERDCVNKNQKLVALRGRELGLMLKQCKKTEISLQEWGENIFGKLESIATLLDTSSEKPKYMRVVRKEAQKIKDISQLPSTRILQEMEDQYESYVDFGMRKVHEFRSDFEKIVLDGDLQK